MSTIKTLEERQPKPPEGKEWFPWMQIPYMQAEIDELREALKAAQEERRSAILLGAEIERNYMALTTERDALVIDRDEWKEATILANQRFKTAEAKLSGAQEKINSMQQNMENIYVENKALQAKLSAIEAQEPVKGWKLVPVEPTQEMLNAPSNSWPADAKITYAAMLSAAPIAPAQPSNTFIKERAQLEAEWVLLRQMQRAYKSAQPVNELVEALEELMRWQVKNVKVWNNSAYDNASRALASAKAAQPLTKDHPELHDTRFSL